MGASALSPRVLLCKRMGAKAGSYLAGRLLHLVRSDVVERKDIIMSAEMHKGGK